MDNFDLKKYISNKKLLNENTKYTLKEDDIFDDTYTVSDEAYDRMDGLTNQKDLQTFLKSASEIMKTLTEDGFEPKDVFYYLYTRLTSNI